VVPFWVAARCANRPKWGGVQADENGMGTLSGTEIFLIVIGAAVMFHVLLKAIAQGAVAVASEEIAERRAAAERRRQENAAAEAAGRAAGLEPLEVNADGSIVEPILAMAEEQSE
jgi:hypothetical protein